MRVRRGSRSEPGRHDLSSSAGGSIPRTASGSPCVLRKISSTPLSAAAPSTSPRALRCFSVERRYRSTFEPRRVEHRVRLVARRQDHPDRRARRVVAREHQRVKRRRVQPVSVVDARQHRPLGRRGEEVTPALPRPGGNGHARPPRQAQRAGEHVALRKRQPGEGGPAPDAAARAGRRTRPRPRPGSRSAAAPSGPRHAPAAKSSNAVFPTPATPRSSSAAPLPARVAPINDSSRASSACRPTSILRA